MVAQKANAFRQCFAAPYNNDFSPKKSVQGVSECYSVVKRNFYYSANCSMDRSRSPNRLFVLSPKLQTTKRADLDFLQVGLNSTNLVKCFFALTFSAPNPRIKRAISLVAKLLPDLLRRSHIPHFVIASTDAVIVYVSPPCHRRPFCRSLSLLILYLRKLYIARQFSHFPSTL